MQRRNIFVMMVWDGSCFDKYNKRRNIMPGHYGKKMKKPMNKKKKMDKKKKNMKMKE
ncbi:MAG: hypothetical protein CM15mV69_580 [Caudoviricetes sp.]|nr:MAG: hypothetical protein CM15mV69_580 [Caudoviricetes sp.]